MFHLFHNEILQILNPFPFSLFISFILKKVPMDRQNSHAPSHTFQSYHSKFFCDLVVVRMFPAVRREKIRLSNDCFVVEDLYCNVLS